MRPLTVLACGVLLVGRLAHSAAAGAVAAAPREPWPAAVFAPYVDVTLWPTPRVDRIAEKSGAKFFNLAFLVAESTKGRTLAWGGYGTYPVAGESKSDEATDFTHNLVESIDKLRAAGGDVMVSFGGANGTPLEAKVTDAAALRAEYQRAIDAYHIRAIDFDVEGAWVADAASVARRSALIAALQKANPGLKVWYTLPVLPTGLTADGLNVLTLGLKAGVRLDGVNVMAMDYGDGAALNPRGKMGDYAIQAATSTHGQLKKLLAENGVRLTDAEVWTRIGVTPMIGVNDTQTEVFDLAAAKQLLAFAKEKKLGFVSFWSANRDHPGKGAVTPNDSGIAQEDYAFSKLLGTYNGERKSSGRAGSASRPVRAGERGGAGNGEGNCCGACPSGEKCETASSGRRPPRLCVRLRTRSPRVRRSHPHSRRRKPARGAAD